MQNNNVLAPLLAAAAHRYSNHDSYIAATLSQALPQLVQQPIETEPAQVSSSRSLNSILTSASDNLLSHIAEVAHLLSWRLAGQGKIPPQIGNHIGVVEIAGPTGMIQCDNCRFGLLLQNPNVSYPTHCHEAEELYLILSGTAEWGKNQHQLRRQRPGTFVHHAKWQPHVMRTLAEPLLALWAWTGNLDFSTYTIEHDIQ